MASVRGQFFMWLFLRAKHEHNRKEEWVFFIVDEAGEFLGSVSITIYFALIV